MAKTIVRRIDRNLARRLREARREVGLSTREVCAKLPARLAVSHTTLAKYENGTSMPPVDLLAALADIYMRTLTWFIENRESLGAFRYRNLGSRVPLKEQRRFEATAAKWADAYRKLRQYLKLRTGNRADSLTRVDLSEECLTPERLAMAVRREVLGLDDGQPVVNVVQVLESFSAWTMEIKAGFGIDGAVARHGHEYFVVLNPETANDRLRLSAAHEVAYLLYDRSDVFRALSEAAIERRAYSFATELLLPYSQLAAAFDGRSFLKLIKYKTKFGISLAAMIYRAEQLRLINTTASRWLWAEMGRRGWRPNEPGDIWRDRAIEFETMLECAIQKKQMTWEDAERITGIRETELRERIDSVVAAHQYPAEHTEEGESLQFEQLRIQS